MIYKSDKEHCREYPRPAEENIFGGVARNFQVFEPLDFLAELTQHIPNKGEHLIRYYGCYSNKARGQAVTRASCPPMSGAPAGSEPPPGVAAASLGDRQARRRWAVLIQRIYHFDPLVCPQCGGKMKIISFVEARQDEVIRKILEHCGLWHDPPLRSPPKPPRPSESVGAKPGRDSTPGIACDIDPDFLEHLRCEKEAEQLELPWD